MSDDEFNSLADGSWKYEIDTLRAENEKQAARIKALEADIASAWATNRAIDKGRQEEMSKRDTVVAELAALRAEIAEPALVRYEYCTKDDDPGNPLERLRFFCSLAMNGQDWLDVEPFFDALTNAAPAFGELEKLRAENAELRKLLADVRMDLVLRAEMDPDDGGAVLNISNGLLRRIDAAMKEQT